MVTKLKNYRLYVIFKIPSLRVLDFQKVKLKERREAAQLFTGEEGENLVKQMHDMKFVTKENKDYSEALKSLVSDAEKKKQLSALVAKCNSLDELKEIEQALEDGTAEEKLLQKKKKSVSLYEN